MTERTEKITYMDPQSLIPYEYNAREHKSEIEFLKNSIEEFGFRNPILADGNNVIIAGHGRRIAAIELGLTRVPVIICDDLTPEQVKALRLADNKLTDLSSWDWDMLNKELAELKDLGWNMEQFAFEDMVQFDTPAEGGLIEDDEEFIAEDIEVQPSKASYNLMVFCTSESEQNDVLGMLSEKGIRCQMM